jgi:tetratricopeptide (TPR) repeat protein
MTDAYKKFGGLMKSGRYRDAVRLADQELGMRGGADPFWLTQKANALNRASDHEQAYVSARSALARDPSNPYAILAAADALFGLHRLEESLSYYREITSHTNLGGRARAGVFGCLERGGRWDELLLFANSRPKEEGCAGRVKALRGLGRGAEALEECRLWIASQPNHPPALWELCELEVESEGLEIVRTRYERLAKIPSLPRVYREIYASLCRKAGLPEVALREYEKLDNAVSGVRVQRKQAFLMAKTGREREAIALMEELLSLDPKDMYLHSSYGAACERVNEIERGIEFYLSLLGKFPEERGLYGRLNRLKKRLEIRDSNLPAGAEGP